MCTYDSSRYGQEKTCPGPEPGSRPQCTNAYMRTASDPRSWSRTRFLTNPDLGIAWVYIGMKLCDNIIDGTWYSSTLGKRVPADSPHFNGQITADGSSGFKAEAGRYHLYVSLGCPWASRTLIYRKLKHLEDVVSYSVVHPIDLDEGWEFRAGNGG